MLVFCFSLFLGEDNCRFKLEIL
uniref:Uncharacterized protein n=1 Tax=Arundo donax TaxID=35708 RepID=A0A0A9AS07_ARUDO